MTYPTFSPPFPPLEPCEEARGVRTITAQFGDGYRQVSVDGPVPESSDVTLTFSPLTPAQYASIESFFLANVGTPITYALPTDGVSRDWVVTMYAPTRSDVSYSLQVKLAPAP